MLKLSLSSVALAAMLATSGCTGDAADRGLGPECRRLLDAGGRELDTAKANGFGSAGAWTRAASLLGAAKVQQQFGEFQNCVIKARRARSLLAELR